MNLRIIRSCDRKVNGACAVIASFECCVALLAMLIVVSTMTGCTSREDKSRKLYEQAQQHIQRSEFVEAVKLYEEIMDRYPGTTSADKASREVSLYRGLSLAVDTYPVRRVKDQMVTTGRAVYLYEARRGRWPQALSDLVPDYLSEAPVDPWGRELIYVVKSRKRGYVLACYGADGRRGGEGEARDWYIEGGRFVDEPSVAMP
jgi:hypothetical protein